MAWSVAPSLSARWMRAALALVVTLSIGLAGFASGPRQALAVSTTVVISQFQIAGATAADEFVELHNVSGSAVDLNGYRLVYRSATGTSDVAVVNWTSSTVVPAGGFYLIAAAVTGSPTPAGYDDPVTANITFNHSGTGQFAAAGGGFALRNGAVNTGTIVDSAGYGTATNVFVESAVTTVPAANASRIRSSNSCTDTDNNSSDFTSASPATPRNASSAAVLCVTSTPTNTPTITPTDTPTDTPLATDTPTNTPLATDTPTDTPLATDTPTNTPLACAAPDVTIGSVQGTGDTAASGTFTVQGVVVGDFEGASPNLRGFYLQDAGDGNPATSDGIFVFESDNVNRVSVGDLVQVTGAASENQGQSQLSSTTGVVLCGTTGSVVPTDVTLPVASATAFEAYEGMLVRFPQPLVIAEYFNYDRFGEIVLAQPLAGEPRPFSGTALDEPGTAANARTAANALRRITLDDANTAQNPSVLRHPNGLPFSLSNLFRGGDTVANTVGVLGYAFSLYRVFPTGPADYTAANTRPAAPEPVGDSLRVAAMNTLNFFVTANYPTGNALDNKCGPLNNLECRGWDSDQATEFTRQRDKLLQALSGLNADIIGLNELENSTGVEPLLSITNGMPGYAYIDTGTIGTDAIKVGLIYRSAVVAPVGPYQAADHGG
jgi:predicted extracellular nuclease